MFEQIKKTNVKENK